VETLDNLKDQIPPGYLAARYEELAPALPPPQADALLQPPAKVSSAAADIFAVFKPAKDYFITPLILNLNLLVFLLMLLTGADLMNPDSRSLLAFGANLRPLTLGGEWWRLITCCFVHIGAVHLAMNMYAFLLIGAQLEPRLGKTRFLAAYLLSGIAASATSLWWHDNNSISAGASGAIFGMYGVFLVMLNANLVEKGKRKQLLASVIFFVGYNLLGGLQAGIDNAAHIGGLLSGMIISACFIPGLRKAQSRRLSEESDLPAGLAEDVRPPVATKDDYYS
jgi:rhomboid protease GluP